MINDGRKWRPNKSDLTLHGGYVVIKNKNKTHIFNKRYFLSGCGGILTGYSGTLASPEFPSRYSNNLTCTWTLQIPANGLLKLHFLVFDTEWG